MTSSNAMPDVAGGAAGHRCRRGLAAGVQKKAEQPERFSLDSQMLLALRWSTGEQVAL
jgi:hypothetical protein